MANLQAESATTIVQRALGWAEHRNRFDSLEDDSPEAREGRLRYDQRRRQVLEALDWNFARGRFEPQALAATAAPANLPYLYQRPPECIRVRGVLVGGTSRRFSAEGNIWSDADADVQIVFTKNSNNPALFAPVFTQALEFLLAAEFAMIYARSVNRSDAMYQAYIRAMRGADEVEAAERSEDLAYDDGGFVDAIQNPFSAGFS